MNTLLQKLFDTYKVSPKNRHDIEQIYGLMPVHKKNNLLKNFEALAYRLEKIEKSIGIKFSQLQKYFAHEFDGHKYVWQCQKELDTVNGVYGKENVIIFSWHENFDSKTSKHHDIILPDNYIGSVDKTFGKKFKEDYAADSSPHFNAAGHLAIYKWLSPHIKSYMEEIG